MGIGEPAEPEEGWQWAGACYNFEGPSQVTIASLDTPGLHVGEQQALNSRVTLLFPATSEALKKRDTGLLKEQLPQKS